MFNSVPQNDQLLLKLYNGRSGKHPGRRGAVRRVLKSLTNYTVNTAMNQFNAWVKLEETLLVKFIDGNVKAQNEDGSFKHTPYYEGTPEGLEQPGYTDKWKEAVVKDHGSVIEVR